MEYEDKPPDCKYKDICSWYKPHCYEIKCWRSTSLDAIISKSKLEEILNGRDRREESKEKEGNTKE